MRELSDAMGDAFGARASSMSGLTPGARLAAVKAQVRRRRVTRHTLEGAASLAVVGAVVVAAWFGLGDRNGPPPVATPTSSPTSSPEVTETPEVVLGDPIDEPGLPTYYEMPEGLLDQVGAGWVLTVHRPSTVTYVDGGQTGEVADTTTVLLASPEGTRFRVAALPSDTNLVPVQWVAGETRVRVWYGSFDELGAYEMADGAEAGWLDLQTGTITSDPAGLGPYELPAGGEDPMTLVDNPGGRWVATQVWGGEAGPFGPTFSLHDRVTGTTTDVEFGVDGKDCAPVGWLDEASLLTLCLDDGYVDAFAEAPSFFGMLRDDWNPAVYRTTVGEDGSSTTLLAMIGDTDPIPEPFSGSWVRDDAVVFDSIEDVGDAGICSLSADMWDGDSFVPVQHAVDEYALPAERVYDTVADGGWAYVMANPGGCLGKRDGGVSTLSLTGHDLETGASVVLIPALADPWTESLRSFVVATP